MGKALDRRKFKAEFEQEEQRPSSKKDLTDALKQILLADKTESQHSENRTPTNAELQQRHRLDRR